MDSDNTSRLAAFVIAASLLIVWVDPTNGGTGTPSPTSDDIEATAYLFTESDEDAPCAPDLGDGYGTSTQVSVMQQGETVDSAPLTEPTSVAMGCRYRIDYVTRFAADSPLFQVEDSTLVLGEWHNDGTPSVMPSSDFAPGTMTMSYTD